MNIRISPFLKNVMITLIIILLCTWYLWPITQARVITGQTLIGIILVIIIGTLVYHLFSKATPKLLPAWGRTLLAVILIFSSVTVFMDEETEINSAYFEGRKHYLISTFGCELDYCFFLGLKMYKCYVFDLVCLPSGKSLRYAPHEHEYNYAKLKMVEESTDKIVLYHEGEIILRF